MLPAETADDDAECMIRAGACQQHARANKNGPGRKTWTTFTTAMAK
jgi:hypothetical protein